MSQSQCIESAYTALFKICTYMNKMPSADLNHHQSLSKHNVKHSLDDWRHSADMDYVHIFASRAVS